METLVGKQAPYFEADAAFGQEFQKISLTDFRGKYLCLFFYPLDFTFVCPTELHAFNEKLGEFQSRNCEMLACSVDSKFSHAAWLRTPKNEGGIQGIRYPILSDIHKTIARSYGTLFEEGGVAFRGLFVIDPEGVVQHALVNNLPLGRNVDEVIRILDAIQFHEKNGEVCPANWTRGSEGLNPTQTGLKEFFSRS